MYQVLCQLHLLRFYHLLFWVLLYIPPTPLPPHPHLHPEPHRLMRKLNLGSLVPCVNWKSFFSLAWAYSTAQAHLHSPLYHMAGVFLKCSCAEGDLTHESLAWTSCLGSFAPGELILTGKFGRSGQSQGMEQWSSGRDVSVWSQVYWHERCIS